MRILTKSAEYYDRAKVIPGRSMTRSKAPGRLFDVGRGPLYVVRGSGALLVDVDGNEDARCGVYAIRHIASGRIYVGSSADIRRRLRHHVTALNEGRHINKYLTQRETSSGSPR